MLRSVVFWGALPWVSLQALRVRRDAPRLAAAAGPLTGCAGSGPALRMVAIGDSIIAGVGASSLDRALVGRTAEALAATLGRAVEWEAVGRIGIASAGVLDELLPRVSARPVDVFLLSVGVNDVTSLSRTSSWSRNLSALLRALAAHSPSSLIAVAGMPPLRSFPLLPQPLRALIGFRGDTFDRISRRIVAAHRQALHVPVEFVPRSQAFSEDGFHPSEASYIDFGRAMADALSCRLSERQQVDPGTRKLGG